MDAVRKRELFERGIELFNRGEFFTCHEVLEEIWLEEPEPEKPFFQGIIQMAAAFHHFQRGNRTGLDSLLRAGVEKLRRFPPVYHGLDLAALLAQLQPWFEHLENNRPLDALPLPTLRRDLTEAC
jgi:predicted metal-dependent hydrolase